MHDIEPYFRWRDIYIASSDERSPFYGRRYSEFYETNKLYNFYLHPQWDEFGSSTLYSKILYVNYDQGYALIEMIGEWNDTLHNDIMFLKREIADPLIRQGINKFVFFCENVLNFHGSEDDYYAEWAEEVREEGGWIALINVREHIEQELMDYRLHQFLRFGSEFNDIQWQGQKPQVVFHLIDAVVNGLVQRLAG